MKRTYFFVPIVGVMIADYISKVWIVKALVHGQGWVVNDYLNIVRVHNTGAAFGFLSGYGGWQLFFLSGLALVVSGVMIYWLLKKPLNSTVLALSFVLIIAGALGNTLDRVLYGYVVDFIDFHYQSWHYPAFNIADIAISLGVVLFMVDLIIYPQKSTKAE